MRSSRMWFPALATLALVLLPIPPCSPAHAFLHDTFTAGPGYPNRIDDYLDTIMAINPSESVDIIVDFCSTPTAADSTFLAGYGTIYGVFRFIDAIAVQNVRVSDCYEIVNYPRVKLIEWDQTLTPHLDVSCAAIQARASVMYPYPSQAVWDVNPTVGYTGNGVNIAIIDGGVDDAHPALAASGVVVVAAAGNSPTSAGITAPASGNLVMAVGGVTDNATIGRGDDTYDSAARYGPRASKPGA